MDDAGSESARRLCPPGGDTQVFKRWFVEAETRSKGRESSKIHLGPTGIQDPVHREWITMAPPADLEAKTVFFVGLR